MNLAKPTNTGPVLEATARLLTDSVWRQRVVEKIVPLSADHFVLSRSFQFEIPIQLVEDLVDNEGNVEVLLPVSWLPKHALLDVDITTADGTSLIILERRSIAGVMSQILDAWRNDIQVLNIVDLDAQKLESICNASLGPWHRIRTQGAPDRTEVDIACDYLNALLSMRVSPIDIDEAWRKGRAASNDLFELLERDHSTAELENTLAVGPILAPYVVPEIRDRTMLAAFLAGHGEAIGQLIDLARQDDAVLGWTSLLNEAGLRWPALVPMSIKPGQGFLIKVREIRDSGEPRNPRVFLHQADISAAHSYHLQVRTPDSSIRLAPEPQITAPDGKTVPALSVFENQILTDEIYSIYSSLSPRPDWVNVRIRYKLHWSGLLGYAFAFLLAIASLTAALAAPITGELAGVLTIPTAFVSAVLLAREDPLAARFLRWWRIALIAVSLFLWLTVAKALVDCSLTSLIRLDC